MLCDFGEMLLSHPLSGNCALRPSRKNNQTSQPNNETKIPTLKLTSKNLNKKDKEETANICAFGNNYVFSLQLRTTQSYWMHQFGPSMETTVKRSTWTVPASLANMILSSYKPSSTAHRGQTKLLQNHNLMCSTLRVQHISQLKIIAFLSLLMPEQHE